MAATDRRTWWLLVALLLGAATVVVFSAAPAAHAGRAAAPADRAQVASCRGQARAAARTAHVVFRVSGRVTMRGCVADSSGIDHMFLAWEQGDGDQHGRICTDPSVVDGAWSCTWDTTTLPPGDYLVRLVAVDDAGNRGTFERRYRVLSAQEREREREQERETEAAPAPGTAQPRRADPGQPAAEEASPAPARPTAPSPTPQTDVAPDPAPPVGSAGGGDDQAPLPAGPAASLATGVPHVLSVAPSPPGPPAAPGDRDAFVAQRIIACDRAGVEGAPTNSAEVVSQLEQAAHVLACLRPALDALGASSREVEAVPVPPALVVEFPDEARLRAAAAALPESVAGVPLRLLGPPQPGERSPASQAPSAAGG